MTYVSRKTRIIVSRWSDECDAEYNLRASRKRSDGRLKRHVSCDDCRAWVNDYCIRHEYLVDFMSDGEKTRLTDDEESEKTESRVRGSKSEADSVRSRGSAKLPGDQAKRSRSVSGDRLDVKDNFSRLMCEKAILEKRLCQCTLILCRALEKLERIDDITDFSCDQTDNTETTRNEEIQNAFYESKLKCTCMSQNNTFENVLPSSSYLKKLKECTEYTKLMRKISDFREKLKKNEKCRQKIGQLIRASEHRAEICASSHQVTELYSRREQAHNNKLRKKFEKLTSEKGRLHFELLQTLKCLNTLKRNSRSSISFTRNKSRTSRNSVDFNCEKPKQNTERCRCPCSEYVQSTDSENIRCSDSSSGECDVNQGFEENLECDFNSYSEPQDAQMNSADKFPDDVMDNGSVYSDLCSFDGDSKRGAYSQREIDSNKSSVAGIRNYRKEKTAIDERKIETSEKKPVDEEKVDTSEEKTIKDEEESEKLEEKDFSRNSSVSFFCPQPSCKRVIDADDLSAYEESVSPEQRAIILEAVKNLETRKLNSSETTKKEKNTVTFAQQVTAADSRESSDLRYTSEREVKFETKMEDDDKNLRNCEQRLNQLDSLESKIEDLKEKSSEANRLKHKLRMFKTKVSRQKAIEKEKSNREIAELCSENWELKKHLQQLSAKFEVQCRKIQSLRSTNLLKERELECEAEELKKELSKYQKKFECQRKYISNLENAVAVQRTEIENLKNHIRKLTTMEEELTYNAYQSRKNIQRSRSYSPEIKTRGVVGRSKPAVWSYRPPEEEEGTPCCCPKCIVLEEQNRRRIQQRNSDRVYCSLPPTRETQWCN